MLDIDGNIVGQMVPDSILCTLQLTIFTINPKATLSHTNHWKTKHTTSAPINANLAPGSYTCSSKFIIDKTSNSEFTNQEEQDAFTEEKRTVELSTSFEVL